MDKIKMLIVDDEAMICDGLASTISWDDIGVTVVGTAYNGNEAVNIIKNCDVDIVLTDVYMPEMDGLALTEYLSDEYPAIEIVMFSGYDEFEYARQALRLGVNDYMLKPVDIDELLDLVASIKKKIEQKKVKEKRKGDKKLQIISEWINYYIYNSPIPSNFKEKTEVPNRYFYRVLVSEMTDYSGNTSSNQKPELLWKNKWKSFLHKKCEEEHIQCTFMSNHINEAITVFFTEAQENISMSVFQNFCFEMNKKQPFPLQHGISSIGSAIKGTPLLFQEASMALSQHRGKRETISSYKEANNSEIPSTNTIKKELQKAVFNDEREHIKELLNEHFDYLVQTDLSLTETLQLNRELEIIIVNNIHDRTSKMHSFTRTFQLQKEVDLKTYNTFRALKLLLLSDLNQLCDTLHLHRQKTNWIIENAVHYIYKNFQHDIKAQQVAEEHFITPNYFSLLFKQETGLSFSEYLNSLRINKASELLANTSNKVFEIAEYVGYKEYKYFVKVFKKNMGVTPTHYRSLSTKHIP
ncbi:response regulator transcription factor [Salibacterium aidingense]|uniref:response regulator transcription factor n=1 Tax=Salibacterium aidingense TaxID=384933 RepID=UPI0004185403|nr:response regulator [Salibacterium aidingense]